MQEATVKSVSYPTGYVETEDGTLAWFHAMFFTEGGKGRTASPQEFPKPRDTINVTLGWDGEERVVRSWEKV